MRFLILFGQCGRGFTGSLRIGKERKTFMSWNPLICEDQLINFINFEALKIFGVKEVLHKVKTSHIHYTIFTRI